jgi:hypothetical protein
MVAIPGRNADCGLRIAAKSAITIRNSQSEIRNEMVRPEGFEPPAYRFEACRSIQLSYGRTEGRGHSIALGFARARCVAVSPSLYLARRIDHERRTRLDIRDQLQA